MPCTPSTAGTYRENAPLVCGRQKRQSQLLDVCRRRFFSLMEILVVVAIITLVLALVIPKVGRLPKKLTIARSLTVVRRAMRETGMRARTSGQAMRLTLDLYGKRFQLQPVQDIGTKQIFVTVPKSRQTSAGTNGTLTEKLGSADDSLYQIPAEIEWRDALSKYGAEEGPSFIFYPNGEASGEPLEFSVAGRRFRLDVDRLLGTPIITESLTR